MEKQYLVTWRIDLTAASPLEAARLALEIQRDESSEALCFDVTEQSSQEITEIDLLEDGN